MKISTPERILLATTGWPRRPGDFAGGFVASMAEALAHRGHRVEIVAPHGRAEHPNLHMHHYRGGALLDGRGAPERIWRGPLRAAPSALGATWALSRAVAPIAPRVDRLVAHWLVPTGVVVARAAWRWGKPCHVYAHGSDVALLERLPTGRLWARWLDDHTQTVVCVSADLRSRLLHLLGRAPRARYPVEPMGVSVSPLGRREVARAALGIDDACPVIATVGRHVPVKGLDVLISALAGTPWVWLAIGDGPERSSLIRAAREAGVEARWVGAASPPIRDSLLGAADVFVQPSVSVAGRGEGTPVSVLEARAHGLPVVASAVGGLAELGGATLAPPGDASALKEAIVEALSAPHRVDDSMCWERRITAHEGAWVAPMCAPPRR